MRTLSRFLSLLICFELIAVPIVGPKVSVINTSNVFAQSCPQGQQMDAVLNRCLTPPETARVMNATAQCSGGDSQCYKNLAQTELDKKVASGETNAAVKDGFFNSGIAKAATTAVPLAVGVAAMRNMGSSCISISYWALIGGGAALAIGDLMTNMQHKKKIKEIEKRWKEISKPSTGNSEDDKIQGLEIQSESFELLAQAEDNLAATAKKKSTFYMIAGLAFTAAAGLAIFEGSNQVTAAVSSCPPSPSPVPATPDSPKMEAHIEFEKIKNLKWKNQIEKQVAYNISQARSLSEFNEILKEAGGNASVDSFNRNSNGIKKLEDPSALEFMKETYKVVMSNLNPFSKAHAQAGTVGAVGGAAAGYVFAESIRNMMTNPYARAAIGGVLAGMSLIMYNHAKKQAEASNNRAEVLRKMKANLLANTGAVYTCRSADREDPAKPDCYCYTSTNEKNPNRVNSDICKKKWGEIAFGKGNYLALATSTTKGCVNSTRQFDQNCSCKKNNSCMKVSLNGMRNVSPGTMSMYAQGLQPLNNATNGNFGSSNVDPASLANQATKLQAFNDKLIKSLKPADGNKIASLTKKFENDLNNASRGQQSSNPLFSSSSSMPSNPGEAAAMLEKELKAEGPQGIGGSDSIAVPAGGNEKKDLEFGLTTDDLAAQEGQLAEVMGQDLDYGQSDVTSSSKTNIFEVLSDRYKRSGMKRLFDDKNPSPVDKPGKTDVLE